MSIRLITAFVISVLFATLFGRFYVPWLRRQKAGQEIREDGPTWHSTKAGTPTMGGVIFILASALGILTVGFADMLQGQFLHFFVFLFALAHVVRHREFSSADFRALRVVHVSPDFF